MSLKAIIPPEEDVRNLELADLINVADIQVMMDNFYRFAHIPMAIIDLHGRVLVGVGWQEICTKFHRIHPESFRNCLESDLKLTAEIPKGEFKLYKCKNGMWDMATPIFIGDQRIGNLFIGQFFFNGESVKYDYFRSQAEKYGFDKEEYIEALRKVPFLNAEDIDYAKSFFLKLTDSLSQLSYSNIKLARAVEETKKLTDSLRRSEERFFTTLTSIGDAVIATDINGSITFINPVAKEIIGLNSTQVLSKPITEIFILIDEQTREIVGDPFKRVLENGMNIGLDKNVILKKKDGTEILIDNSAAPIRDKDGQIFGMVLVFRDVTERIMAEKMLEENKARLERSQIIAQLGSWELDLKNNILTWSDEVYRIFGLTPGEFKPSYKAFLEAIHPDDRAAVDKAYSQSLKKKNNNYEIEHRIIKKSGEIRFVHEKCEHFRNDSGKIIRSIGMVHDITDRKKAEKDLKESKEKLNIALEIGEIGVWEWNLLTDEMVIDERMEKILGLEPATFKGTYNDFENLLNDEDIPHFKNTITKALNEFQPFETIFRIRTKTNESKYINVKAIVEDDETGSHLKMTGVCYDITEMKSGAENVLFKLNEELLRSNRALEHFAYVASHDLQEPLRMVSSFTQLLSMKYKDKLDDNAREYIQFAVEGTERMYAMINDLLAYSRIQTRVNEFKEVDMNHVMEYVKKILSIQIQQSKASVTYSNLPKIFADENQIIQLMQNLVSNAIKFSNNTPEVHISFKSDTDNNTFSVADNGIGIEPQYFENIFKIFQRLMPKEEYAGTGIGLAICKVIVERHGGKIWVESEPDKGSTFYFTTPKNSSI